MTTPIDELAGTPLTAEEEAALREQIAADTYWVGPRRVARLLATLDAARSTPVPASNVSEGPYFAYFTIHGEGWIVTDKDRPAPSRVATVDTAPDDYGRANTLRIVEALNRSASNVSEGLREALDKTAELPEDAPPTSVGGDMYAAGWSERGQAIAALARSSTEGLTCLDYAAHDWNSNGSPSFCRQCWVEWPRLEAARRRLSQPDATEEAER